MSTDGIVQDCNKSNALAMGLFQSCIEPSNSCIVFCINSNNIEKMKMSPSHNKATRLQLLSWKVHHSIYINILF